MYTTEEMSVLKALALEWYGEDFNELTYEEQDAIVCYAEENIWH